MFFNQSNKLIFIIYILASCGDVFIFALENARTNQF